MGSKYRRYVPSTAATSAAPPVAADGRPGARQSWGPPGRQRHLRDLVQVDSSDRAMASKVLPPARAAGLHDVPALAASSGGCRRICLGRSRREHELADL
jgi:hypothetical protein